MNPTDARSHETADRPRIVTKQAQLRAAARLLVARPRSSSASSHSTMSATATEESRTTYPRFHPNTLVSTKADAETARNVPTARGEWKPVVPIVPPMSYPGILSSPPSPRSLHAAVVISLPLGWSTYAWNTRNSPLTTQLTNPANVPPDGDDTLERTTDSDTDLASTLAPKGDTVLVVFGGYDGSARRNDLYEFDFDHKCWSLISPHRPPTTIIQQQQQQQLPTAPDILDIPRPRDRHVAVAHGTCVYIFAGFDGTARVNDFWAFDYRTRSWRLIIARPLPLLPNHHQGLPDGHVWIPSDPPSSRHSHCAAVYKNSIYVFGGYDGSYRSDFHLFDLDLQAWKVLTTTTGGRTPRARYRATCVVHDDAFFLFGGHDGTRHLADLHAFDFFSGTWSSIVTSLEPSPLDGLVRLGATAPIPRDSHVSVVYRDCMYVFGGSSGSAMNDMWECVLPKRENGGNTNTWTLASWRMVHGKGFVTHRFCHVGAVHQDSLYVFGGYDGTSRLNDFIRFQYEVDDLCCEIPPSTIIEDLRNCLKWDNLSDVTFIVEGRPIHAHKVMLMRCPYFCAMFNAEMKESKQSTIDIYDIRFPIFSQVLEYIYTDVVPNLNVENAMELYIAADLFGLIRLQAICENRLLESMTVENAASLFHIADMYLATNLRSKTLKYILSHFESVTKTVAFEDMARANVELVFEILRSPR